MAATTDLVVLKLALVVAPIGESQPTLALFFTILVFAFITGAIRPGFDSLAVLLIVDPLSLVIGAICMRVCAHALCLVIDPLALIDIAICMNQFSLSVRLVIPPLTFISTSIGPKLRAHTIASVRQPLAGVGSSIRESEWALIDTTKLIYLLARHVWVSLLWATFSGTFVTEGSASFCLIVIRLIFTTVFVLKIVLVNIVDHILLIKRLAYLSVFVLSLAVAVTSAVSHLYKLVSECVVVSAC